MGGQGPPRSLSGSATSKSFLLFYIKNLFFLFYTLIFTKYPHQSIYSTHLFNKIFILLPIFIIFLLTASLSQTQPPSSSLPQSANRPNQHHHHHSITPHPATIITHPTSIIMENQPIQAETHSIRNPFNRKPVFF